MFSIEEQKPSITITLEGDSVDKFKRLLRKVRDQDFNYIDDELARKMLKEMCDDNEYRYDY